MAPVPQEDFFRAGNWALLASVELLGGGHRDVACGQVPDGTAKCHQGPDKGQELLASGYHEFLPLTPLTRVAAEVLTELLPQERGRHRPLFLEKQGHPWAAVPQQRVSEESCTHLRPGSAVTSAFSWAARCPNSTLR